MEWSWQDLVLFGGLKFQQKYFKNGSQNGGKYFDY